MRTLRGHQDELIAGVAVATIPTEVSLCPLGCMVSFDFPFYNSTPLSHDISALVAKNFPCFTFVKCL